MQEQDTLYALAEIAVGLAGFSAIVVLFKRRDSGLWREADADRFHGMVLHAIAAAGMCLLPAIVSVFVATPASVWAISSALLGLQILGHTLAILLLTTTSWGVRIGVGLGGFGVAGLQVLNVIGVPFSREFGPYLVGIAWHLIQAGVLFVALVWVPGDQIESD